MRYNDGAYECDSEQEDDDLTATARLGSSPMKAAARRKAKAKLMVKYNGQCAKCRRGVISSDRSGSRGRNPLVATIDHIVPRSAGGTNAFENLQLLCHECNSKKGCSL